MTIYLPSRGLFRFIILWELGAAARNHQISEGRKVYIDKRDVRHTLIVTKDR